MNACMMHACMHSKMMHVNKGHISNACAARLWGTLFSTGSTSAHAKFKTPSLLSALCAQRGVGQCTAKNARCLFGEPCKHSTKVPPAAAHSVTVSVGPQGKLGAVLHARRVARSSSFCGMCKLPCKPPQIITPNFQTEFTVNMTARHVEPLLAGRAGGDHFAR